jgi:protein arginine kinase
LHTVNVDNLIKSAPPWLAGDSGTLIAVSSRVRLARNVSGAPFPARCSRELRSRISERIRSAQRDILLERRLASRELCSAGPGGALVVTGDGRLSLMINEEDHIRIQAVFPGLSLSEAWETASRTDRALSERLDYSFDDTWGYLTSCPTNLGTGLRASVMLHLPALGLAGMMEPVVHAVQTLGFEVRGALGEGTEAVANMFQISNQSTLGESETEIMRRLEALIRQLIWHEQNARIRLTRKERDTLYDTVGRAYGILRYAYSLTTREALNGLSAVRLGVDLSMFSGLSAATIDKLFLAVQPGHLQWRAGQALSSDQRDTYRAGLARDAIGGRPSSASGGMKDKPRRA